jgi:hypothetical protein
MREEKINFYDFDWTEVEYMNCDCCKKFSQTINTNCNWIFKECENVGCAIKINVCIVCASSGEWWCEKHQKEYIRKLQREEIENEINCDYIGEDITESPVHYDPFIGTPRYTKVVECVKCDIYFRVCEEHRTPQRFTHCKSCFWGIPKDELIHLSVISRK